MSELSEQAKATLQRIVATCRAEQCIVVFDDEDNLVDVVSLDDEPPRPDDS
jgi:hypothetical protein